MVKRVEIIFFLRSFVVLGGREWVGVEIGIRVK